MLSPFRTPPAALLAAALLFLAPAPAEAQVVGAEVAPEAVDLDVVARIRAEGLERSRVPELAGHLTDVIGPRLTGSPAMRRANEWTAERFRAWGLENVVIEPWGEFGRGWENLSIAFRALTPYPRPLIAVPVAWTGGTDGAVRGPALRVQATTPEDVDRYRGRVAGAFLLVDEPADIGPELDPRPRRHTDEWLADVPPRRPAPAAGPTPEELAERERAMEARRRQWMARDAVLRLAWSEGAAAVLTGSGWPYGVIRIGGAAAWRPGAAVPPPQLVLAQEHYGWLWRNLGRGLDVELELDVRNRWHDDDPLAYNTLADLPGTDLADEYVMIGAHLDSWHAGTGATDNAAGSVVVMEAMRILRAIGVRPRRTIRVALWSGEEQGLLGSRRWLDNHPDLHDRISAYLNIDNGTGRVRGIWSQENDAAVPILEAVLAPFRDLDVVGVRHAGTGGTDHIAFDRLGIPGFNMLQDPIEYSIRTHHSHVDTFEHLVLDDLRQAAVVVAATAYHLATRDAMMPRKPVDGTTP